MALPVGLTALGEFKGDKGDPGTLDWVSARDVPYTQPAAVRMKTTTAGVGAEFDLRQGMPGVNAVENDTAVAAYIGSTTTESRRAVNVATGEHGGYVNVRDYGAGEGVDDTTAFIDAAAAATASGRTLFIPEGEFRISDVVPIRTNIRSAGTILVDAATTGAFSVARAADTVNIDPGVLTGLTAGSTMVSGLPGAGTLSIRSSEKLIGRRGYAESGSYTKNEAVRVFSDGTITPALEHTYDTAKITSLRWWPDEPTRTIEGLRILVDGAGSHTEALLTLSLTDADVDVTVMNTTGSSLPTAVRVSESGRLRFKSPRISGFSQSGTGYGVLLDHTYDITFETPDIAECRHPIAGRHNRGVIVNGGTLYGGFDTHWGGDVVLNNVTSILTGLTTNVYHVLTAGRGDVRIIGGRFYGGRSIHSIRTDTPEMDGNLIIDGAEWWPANSIAGDTTDRHAIAGYGVFHDLWGTFNFGRTLAAPSVRILNTTVHGSTRKVSGFFLPVTSFARNQLPAVEVANVKVSDSAQSFTTLWVSENGTSVLGTTRLMIRDVVFKRPSPDNPVFIGGPSAGTPKVIVDVVAEGCENVFVRAGERTSVSLLLRRCTIAGLTRDGAAPLNVGRQWRVEDSILDAAYLSGGFVADFLRCWWSGTTNGNTGGPVNDKVRSFIGNMKEVGSTGAPTVADGYRNPAYYT